MKLSNTQSAINKLKNNGIELVRTQSATLIQLPTNRPIGLKLWSAIDYLCNRCSTENYYFNYIRKEV